MLGITFIVLQTYCDTDLLSVALCRGSHGFIQVARQKLKNKPYELELPQTTVKTLPAAKH